jgi:hypothetical protein
MSWIKGSAKIFPPLLRHVPVVPLDNLLLTPSSHFRILTGHLHLLDPGLRGDAAGRVHLSCMGHNSGMDPNSVLLALHPPLYSLQVYYHTGEYYPGTTFEYYIFKP